MNVLLLSVGSRNKIVQYFKKELNGIGLVIATDASSLAPALYEADKYYIVPKIDEPGYIETIIDISLRNNVKMIMTLIDPELELISMHKQRFVSLGILPLVSDLDTVKLCFNKYDTYMHLSKNNINVVKTYLSKEEFVNDYAKGKINFPVFAKPVCGSASINVSKVNDMTELDYIMTKRNDLVVQPFMAGNEYGVDLYVDLESKKPVSMFIKRKITMRAGETDKSVSIIDSKIQSLVLELTNKIQFLGPIDLDIFEDNGQFFISEINPRFGGGYPHAYECGVNFHRFILNNLRSKSNLQLFNNYDSGIYMMKYNDIKILR